MTGSTSGSRNGSITVPPPVPFYKTAKWIHKWTPKYGCTTQYSGKRVCKHWALPTYIVDCESGGDYTPPQGLKFGGAYGILRSTWKQYGGKKWAPQANMAVFWQQDIIARKVWKDVGPSGWACA